MRMVISKRNGEQVKGNVPAQFVPFRSGLAGQTEQHAEELERWIKSNMGIICSYTGVQDGIVYLAEQ